MFKFRINLLVVLLSFIFGIILVYLMSPHPITKLRFPSPFNTGKIKYKDNGDSCYVFKSNEVPCSDISKPQPIFDDSI